MTGITLLGCNSANRETATEKMNDSSAHTTGYVSPFTSPANGILHIYLHLKNAFVNDNDKAAASTANEMVKVLSAFDKRILREDERAQFENIADSIKEQAENIGLNTGNIKHQREYFDMISKAIYSLIKTFAAGQQIYVNYCPMYNDHKGAIWLSETNEIRNPYFGSAMLTCGNVTEIIQ